MRFGLQEIAIQEILTILEQYEQVEKAILFGSRAKGNYKNGSDIDLALDGGITLTRKVLSRIFHAVDDLNLPYSIELSIMADITNPELIEEIHQTGAVLYQRSQAEKEKERA